MNIIAQEVHEGTGALKVMVKDSIDIRGLRTMAGSKALMEVEPALANAEVIDLILKADCVITAKPICMNWHLVLQELIPYLVRLLIQSIQI